MLLNYLTYLFFLFLSDQYDEICVVLFQLLDNGRIYSLIFNDKFLKFAAYWRTLLKVSF